MPQAMHLASRLMADANVQMLGEGESPDPKVLLM
jgi:hypothetical protein